MALKLSQEFDVKLDLSLIKKIIQNPKWQEFRNEGTRIIENKLIDQNNLQIIINKTVEIDLPSNITSMVSNPFEINELWKLDNPEEIIIKIEIPKVKTTIDVQLKQSESNKIIVLSTIKSDVFMMGTFVEEHVAKYWKNLIEKDLTNMLKFSTNQV